MSTDDQTEIRITDFRMAGFLVARGRRFDHLAGNLKGEVVFVFTNEIDSSGKTAMSLLNTYPGSPEYQYDAACRTMHDFVKLGISRNDSSSEPKSVGKRK